MSEYVAEELLPCPFCGQIPKMKKKCDDDDLWDVECGTKGCYLEYGADWWIYTRSEAIAIWNLRFEKPKK